MERLRLAGFAVAGITAALVLTGAQRPAALGGVAPGLWEITGLPGMKAPARECLTDMTILARYEHRSRTCAIKLISDGPSSVVFDYSCGGGGFGHTKIDVITPRSLRIETQGVADSLPFSDVLQARRVGDCPATASAARH